MRVVCDIETNALKNPDKLWVVVTKNVDDPKDVRVFTNEESGKPTEDFREFAKQVSCWVGHNFIDYDAPVLNAFYGFELIRPQLIVDTLVVSRLLNAARSGGHSLEQYGNELGVKKVEYDAWDEWDPRIITRCTTDVDINYKVYELYKKYIESDQWAKSLRLEHDMAIECHLLNTTGFYFKKDKALNLYNQLTTSLKELDKEILKEFPPKIKFIKEVTPAATKYGTISKVGFNWWLSKNPNDLSPFSVGVPFSRIEYEPFNLGSPKQIVERLNEAGWQPTDKTKGHIEAERSLDFISRPYRGRSRPAGSAGNQLSESDLRTKLENYRVYGWRINETNLSTLPDGAPGGARLLARRLLTKSRESDLEEWLVAFNEQTGRIHGTFTPIGAWVHRMSHSGPNMANIPSPDRWKRDDGQTDFEKTMEQLAYDMRDCWAVPDGSYLVGTDADAIHLRILAHLMGDEIFTEALINGDSKKGTDAHTMNQKALNSQSESPICASRGKAKTFIYSWLNGAAVPKVSSILSCSPSDARNAINAFIGYYPGLTRIKKEQIPEDAARGYFVGLDGRCVMQDAERLMLAGYLQNGESTIMKMAARKWRTSLAKTDLKWVNFVHDEWQTEVRGSQQLAEEVGKVQSQAIVDVGLELNLKCPLKGNYKIGQSWAETH